MVTNTYLQHDTNTNKDITPKMLNLENRERGDETFQGKYHSRPHPRKVYVCMYIKREEPFTSKVLKRRGITWMNFNTASELL